MPSFDDRLLVFDTETTGVDPANDRVVALGACYFEARAYVEHRRNLVDPGIPIPEGASAVHGITDARVAGKPRFAEIASRFGAHLDGSAKDGLAPILSERLSARRAHRGRAPERASRRRLVRRCVSRVYL